MRSITTRLTLFCAVLVLFTSVGCKRNDDSSGITPKGSAPAWAPNITNEMLTIIEELDSMKQPPVDSVAPTTARGLHPIFDAAANVAARYGISGPVFTVDAQDYLINANGTTLNTRIYRPHTGSGPFACIVYFHGGGWVIGSTKTYNWSASSIAEQTGAVVVSVDYRLAPENKFPTAHKDAFGAYKWVLANASLLKIDPSRVAVAGEDAGANLAFNVCVMARDSGATMPKHQLLIYPIAQTDTTIGSYVQYADAQPLRRKTMSYFFNNYLSSGAQRSDSRISLVNADMSYLPSTTIINADIDPLRDDGALLQTKLSSAGVVVTRKLYDGVTHDFYGISSLLPQARDAQGYGTAALRLALQ